MGKEAEKVAGNATENVSLAHHEQKVGEMRDQLSAKATEADSLRAKLSAVEERVGTLEKERDETGSSNTALTDDKAALTARANRLEAELKASRDAKDALAIALNEQAEKMAATEAASLSAKVQAVIQRAIDDKVLPSLFEGYEADPAAWMTGKYVSFEAFEDTINTLRGAASRSAGSAFKSGHDPAKAAKSNELQLTAEQREQIGLKSETFVGVTTEKEARERFEAMKAEKK